MFFLYCFGLVECLFIFILCTVNLFRSSNEYVRTSYEKQLPVLRMTWQPSNSSESNPDEITRHQKEIESQQIDEWMIAQG